MSTVQTPAFSSAKFTPKHIRVTLEISQQLLDQTKSRGLDLLILNDVKASLAEEFDRQLFKGDKTSDEIDSLKNTTGISSSTWAALTSLSGASASRKVNCKRKKS